MSGEFTVEWTATGTVYKGLLQDDKLHGDGLLTFKEGAIASIDGTWNQGELETCRLMTRRDESTATNYQPSSGKLVGEGTVKVENSTFTGTWD